jgi:IclR family transcriptional regulator, mhp operon transcriptional activator
MSSQELWEGDTDCRPDIVRSVVRAFSLIRLMNFRRSWTLQALHDETGLPKATLWRLLSTLRHEGYVVAEDRIGTYRLASKVRELDNGYTESNRLADLARPKLIALTKKIKWPLALGTLDIDAMVIQFTSAPYSPLALYTTTVGQRRNLLDSAMGRVHLSFCSANEKTTLLENLVNAPAAMEVDSLASIERDLSQIREAGYAVRQVCGYKPASSTLAVPVLVDGESIGALSMTTFPRCMTAATIEKHLPILIETAHSLALEFLSEVVLKAE